MNKYEKLVMNSIVFAIGNFGSKFIGIIMVPLYTHVLSTNEYGEADLLITTISLLLPILVLSIGQAVIRFSVSYSGENNRAQVYSNAMLINIMGSIILMLFYPILHFTNVFGDLLLPFIILMISRIFSDTLSQFSRGIGKIKEFAFNGILMTLITAGLNVYFLLFLKIGLSGYLLSMIIANVISNIYLFLVVEGYKLFSVKNINQSLLNKMLSYSVPLIPNNIMWWLINGSTRYFILIFLGAGANGIFAVANKIPSILSMATNIFSQAWQLSAFEEYNTEDKSKFYSTVFKNYYTIIFILASGILIISKILIINLVSTSFSTSWQIVPFLLLAAIYQSFSGFLGTNYTAALNTKGIFSTSVYCALISVLLNVFLIPLIGIFGAGVGTCIAFFTMWIIRLHDTKKYVETKVNYKEFLMINIVFILQSVAMFIFDNYLLLITETTLFIIMMFVLRVNLLNVLKAVKHK